MSDFDVATVHHIARLARLRADSDQSESLAAELARIVDFVGVLEQLPTPAATFEDERTTPLREDVVSTTSRPDELLAGAPDVDGSHLRVPAVIRDAT
ncbi:MAG: aspartyl/glutamyl-tRNA amidotransferase subunit C [Proteobacteria bacterium]|nr:aspartyl/glutamyl-tRNA amidotransferase subunit C [Pseudomonadota bacterium]